MKGQAYSGDKAIFSSERMLHNDYYCKSSVGGKKSLFVGLKKLDAKASDWW
jgi:hypothetical protein